jgi:hypothetical protein
VGFGFDPFIGEQYDFIRSGVGSLNLITIEKGSENQICLSRNLAYASTLNFVIFKILIISVLNY